MKPRIDYSLYLVTDSELMSTDTVERSVELAVSGGCTLVQLREKEKSSLDFYNTAIRVRDICRAGGVPLIINDRVDIALAVDADGVHIGQSDIPAKVARRLIGPDKILGVSAATLDEALLAERDGADYLGIGAMFTTGTKSDARAVPLEELHAIRAAVGIPIVAIGGISKATLPLLAGAGLDGISVVSAIIAAADIPTAAMELKTMFHNLEAGRDA